MSNLRVKAHSDSCTYVYGKSEEGGADHTFTISGSSPAVPHVLRGTIEVGQDGVEYEVVKQRAERGSLAKIMENPAIPTQEKFTITEFAELNGVPYPYASKWVKDNCSPAGFKEKPPGQRGKASELFRKL
jgi:hypothetical protein